MPIGIDNVAAEMARRRQANSPLLERLIEIRDRYNGDWVVPVPDTDDDVPLAPLTPLLITDAVDHTALRAADVSPTLFCPALDPTKETGVRSLDYATRRRKALGWVWDESWWELLAGRFYRHLTGYSISALHVELDYKAGRPILRVRDPLGAYPEPKAPEDLTLPSNVGFVYGRSLDWLHFHYPQTQERWPKGASYTGGGAELWDVVEWCDDEQTLTGVLGPRSTFGSWTNDPTRWAMELRTLPNPIGRCPAVIPGRVTLDRIASQLANLTGHVDFMARLMYLDVRASERSIYPDRYILGRAGQNPQIVGGQWAEGHTGEVNVVLDAEALGELRGTPDPNNKITMDRLERNMRTSAGLVPQFGGETYGALRTGRGIDTLMGAAVDPRVRELHRVAERYFTAANELILDAFKTRWGPKRYVVWSGWPGDPGHIDFEPNVHVETNKNRVAYPLSGADTGGITISVAQMLQARLISLSTARRLHPNVLDPEHEERQQIVDDIRDAVRAAFLQRAAQGGIPPEDAARVEELVEQGQGLAQAIQQANREASERQASQAPPPQPGQVAAPETMPGLGSPGEGAGQPQPPPEATRIDQFRQMVAALGAGQ